jgi:hypothetical protein
MRCVLSGMFHGLAVCACSINPPITINLVAPDRLASERCAKRACDYRQVHIQLRRKGWCHGQNKTRRIYRELGLQLRNNTPKRRVKAKLRKDRRPATRSNETWAMDFVHDQLATGRKLRVLTIVDTFSRFSPALARKAR